MPTARSYLATVTVNGKVYAIGGIDNNGNYLNRVEVYNPATNNWSQAAPMPTARGSLAAAVDAQGNIYAIGGLVSTGGPPQILSTVEVYNPTTNSWGQARSMSLARYSLAAVTDAQGNIYAIGGISLNGINESVANTVEVYNPTISGWSMVANMLTGRFGLTAATDTQGNIYAMGGCCGGTNSAPAILSTVEVYSPATNSWSTAAPMPSARAFLAAALGAQGHISAIGGYNAVNFNNLNLNFSSPLNTVEVYNPTTSSWTTAANMPTARAGLVAGADAQGNIYAIGGLNSASMASSATERYSPPITVYVFIHQ